MWITESTLKYKVSTHPIYFTDRIGDLYDYQLNNVHFKILIIKFTNF